MPKQNSKSLYSLRKVPTQSRSQATVEAVLEAGARLLLTIGYENASTNKIAELAGVGIGSLYEYFPGKEAVFAELRRREDRRHLRLLLDEPPPETLSEMLKLQTSTYLKLVRTNIELHTALVRDVPQFAIVEEESEVRSEYIPRSIEFLTLHSDSIRPKCDIPVIVELLTRVLRSAINDYALYAPERLQDETVADELQDMLERYLLN